MTAVSVILDGQRHVCKNSDALLIGGDGSAIPVPGDTSQNEYARLENRDGHLWIIPASSAVSVQLNGHPVSGAMPIRNGDIVSVGSAVLNLRSMGDDLRIDFEDAEPVPAVPRPMPRTVPSPGRLRTLKLILFGVFGILLTAASFVFVASPVSVTVVPDPDESSIDGFFPVVPLQDRNLVLPGHYVVEASKKGYEVLRQTVLIEGGELIELEYELTKLPGRVSLHSQPQSAEVTVDGEPLGLTPLIDEKIAAGSHKVVVSADRYQDAVLELVVEGMDQQQVVHLSLVPDWAPISFRTEPAGASVRVDNEIVGTTPLTLDILSGVHSVEFQLDRFKPRLLEFSVVAGEAQALPMMVLRPKPGELSLLSTPVGATVTVDDVYRGSTPVELMLSPGEDHQLVLAMTGHLTVKRQVNLSAAEKRRLSIELPAEFGVVFVTSEPPDADLLVDGKSAGKANRRLRLTTRQHLLEFRREGYEPQQILLTPRAGVSKQLSISLVPVNQVGGSNESPQTLTTTDGQELKLVGPAQFTMGASRREQGRRANENMRKVELTREYYIGVKEVTNAEYRLFKAEHDSGTAYGRSLNRDSQPVVNVSWENAVAYLNWLSKKEGLSPAYRKNGESWEPIVPLGTGYRLPTEAEWARAARHTANGEKKYAWTGVYPPAQKVENFGDRSAAGILPSNLSSYDDGFVVAAPVGSFKSNPLGLYDIGGNVAEWTNDYYTVYPSGEEAVVRDPLGPESGRHHVVRGSGWKDSTISELRLSYRDYSDVARNDVGFRIARYAE